jgi:hypothetical protein
VAKQHNWGSLITRLVIVAMEHLKWSFVAGNLINLYFFVDFHGFSMFDYQRVDTNRQQFSSSFPAVFMGGENDGLNIGVESSTYCDWAWR